MDPIGFHLVKVKLAMKRFGWEPRIEPVIESFVEPLPEPVLELVPERSRRGSRDGRQKSSNKNTELPKFKLTYKPFGPSAILVEWPAKIEEAILHDILAFEESIDKGRIIDTIIAYNSLTLRYRSKIDFDSEIDRLKEVYKSKRKIKEPESKTWLIPVCYDLDFGLDLEEIARAKNLSVNEVIALHTDPDYLVYFIGFQPGFPYLGGLHQKIHTPRKASPRLRVAQGSVGIGGEQTGVYPQESAGGWNILGRTPTDFFDLKRPEPCFAKPGDRIKFEPIDREKFQKIEAAVQEGSYKIKFRSL